MTTSVRCAYVADSNSEDFTVGKGYLTSGNDGRGFLLDNNGGSWMMDDEGFSIYSFGGDLVATFEDVEHIPMQPSKEMVEAGIKELETIFTPRQLEDFDEDDLSDTVVFIWQAMDAANNKKEK